MPKSVIIRRFPLHYVNPFRTTGYKKYRRSWVKPITPPGVSNVEERDNRMIYLQAIADAAKKRGEDAKQKLNAAQLLASVPSSQTPNLRASGCYIGAAYIHHPLKTKPIFAPRGHAIPAMILDRIAQNNRLAAQEMIGNKYFRKYGKEKPQYLLDKDVPKNVEPLIF